jgi:putative DNA primase/helicase
MTLCLYCGASIKKETRYCPECGEDQNIKPWQRLENQIRLSKTQQGKNIIALQEEGLYLDVEKTPKKWRFTVKDFRTPPSPHCTFTVRLDEPEKLFTNKIAKPIRDSLKEIYGDHHRALNQVLKIIQLNEDSFKTEQDPDDEARGSLPYFTDEGAFIPYAMAKEILAKNHYVTHTITKEMYVYIDGIYRPEGEVKIEQVVQDKLKDQVKTRHVNEVIDCIKRETYQPPKKFENPDNQIAVKNGLLDVKKQELHPFTPEKIHIIQVPVKYSPDAKCPKIIHFFKQVNHLEDIPVVQEMFGYCLYKDYPVAKAFMLLGGGENGKSTSTNLLEAFLGKTNIATPSLQNLLDNRFASIELYNKLANIHADLSPAPLQNTGVFKMLTGRDLMWADKKHVDPFQFVNYAKLIYSANELPKTDDRTKAFFRRWIIIEYPNEFPEDSPDTDPHILEKLTTEEELSGLLNWALQGLRRVLENGRFSTTEPMKEIEKKWIIQTDSLRAFCNIALEKQPESYIVKKDLWETAYQDFCERYDIYSVKQGNMTKRLPTILPYVKQVRVRKIEGLPRCWKDVGFTQWFIEEFPETVKNVQVYQRAEDGEYGQQTLEMLTKEPEEELESEKTTQDPTDPTSTTETLDDGSHTHHDDDVYVYSIKKNSEKHLGSDGSEKPSPKDITPRGGNGVLGADAGLTAFEEGLFEDAGEILRGNDWEMYQTDFFEELTRRGYNLIQVDGVLRGCGDFKFWGMKVRYVGDRGDGEAEP